jgi:hypothetical protein
MIVSIASLLSDEELAPRVARPESTVDLAIHKALFCCVLPRFLSLARKVGEVVKMKIK